jgi:hypothetical protein
MPLDALGDHLRVWRTVRGIGVSFAILAGVWFYIYAPMFGGTQVPPYIPYVVSAIVLVFAMVIVSFYFSRLSASLLASVWVVARKDEELLAASIEAKRALKQQQPKPQRRHADLELANQVNLAQVALA